ncbi:MULTISPECIES: ABC transporter permease [Chelativorans]|jgi:putative ABC transport system permease protein|uniref:Inner-membrane translocator n=1 Tax=Chelativorans sp. (strain BNC1) TaxID=266779 RepID=Q11ED1_CHESB|nr:MULTISPECIES: ABC transporter permease [Chelativorans]
MSAIAFWGAVELGLVYGFVALGVFLAFRILDFPDLTVDGSFPLGAAVAAVAITAGWNPWLACLVAALGGAACGLVTAFLNVRFGILNLLASILTMIALFSVNLRIMGRPNMAVLNQDTVVTSFYDLGLADHLVRPLLLAILILITLLLLARFLGSDFGLAMRAAGANARMARANGVDVGGQIYVGMALSNALTGLGGALFAQVSGFADVTSGVGTIVVGLASVIVGETLLRSRSMLIALFSCVLGSVIYRVAVQLALSADLLYLNPSDLNLVTAVLVALALILPKLRAGKGAVR